MTVNLEPERDYLYCLRKPRMRGEIWSSNSAPLCCIRGCKVENPIMVHLTNFSSHHSRSSSDASMSMANMTYATASPAATTGGQGNGPVSCQCPSRYRPYLGGKSYRESWHHSNRAPAFSHFLIDSNLSQSYHLSHLCSSQPLIFIHNGDNFG